MLRKLLVSKKASNVEVGNAIKTLPGDACDLVILQQDAVDAIARRFSQVLARHQLTFSGPAASSAFLGCLPTQGRMHACSRRAAASDGDPNAAQRFLGHRLTFSSFPRIARRTSTP